MATSKESVWLIEAEEDGSETFVEILYDEEEAADSDQELEYLEEDANIQEIHPVQLIGMYDENETEIPIDVDILYQSDDDDLEATTSARPCDAVVIAKYDSVDEVPDDNLAEEHEELQSAQQEDEQPQHDKERPGQRRKRAKTTKSGWNRGDKLIELYLDDKNVPEPLIAEVMQVVASKEAQTIRRNASRKRRNEDNDDDDDNMNEHCDEALFPRDKDSLAFKWSPMDTFQGVRETFQPKRTGPTVNSKTAYGAFRRYWDDGILSHIVTETNRYAAQIATSSTPFARSWYDTNLHEIMTLFAFWMMLGIIRMPSTKSCFTLNPLLKTSVFAKLFSRNRYTDLCRALHFVDNNNKPTDDSNRLYCFGPVLDHLNSRFKSAYVPKQNVCIDESLTLWQGRLSFRQYIRTKAARFGVKTYELCESATGYLWSFFIYTGGSTLYDAGFPSTLLKCTATVLKLARPLLDKGYTIFMDNWYNSPLLARYLKRRRTDCVGTLCANRRNVSPLMALCELKEGHFAARHSGDVCIMAYQDKRKVLTISTFHGTAQKQTEPKPNRPVQYKPQVILDYNKNMGGVDRKDQMLEPYLIERKRCAKWYLKVFKRFLNCSILNSRILLEASTGNRKEHIIFRLELVEQIIKYHHKHVPKSKGYVNVVQSTIFTSRYTDNKHWPRLITQKLVNQVGRTSRRRCIYCTMLRRVHPSTSEKRTLYVCSVCEVPLCIDPCFGLYHTIPSKKSNKSYPF